MLSRLHSGALVGVDAVVVTVEVDMSLGLPFFNLVGLPEGAAKESRVRVIAALKNSGYELPQKRITVNLAPAEIRKDGAAFELPIAVGLLSSAGIVREETLSHFLYGGELSLDGRVKAMRGALSMAIAAKAKGFLGVIVPAANAQEAAMVEGIDVIPVNHLREVVAHLAGTEVIAPVRENPASRAGAGREGQLDMSDVRGQSEVKAAIELAAAGGHNLLMCGPPGSGKSMLARRIPGILPPMTTEESLEVTKVYSVLGLLPESMSKLAERPFRSPHHSISDAGLTGGGPNARPGELSLAHRGVLFLDELPEFRRNVLEVLRQPLEEGLIRLARANQNVVYPAKVMLVAAMNPCPCGYHGVHGRVCRCPKSRVDQYLGRISGPLLDRIDITLETRAVDLKLLGAGSSDERPSSWYRARIDGAQKRQRERFRDDPGVFSNAQMSTKQVHLHCRPSARARKDLERAVERYGLSARAYDRILKIALTRADLEGHQGIEDIDLRFAIGCRVLDRKSWLTRSDTAPSPFEPAQVASITGGIQ